MTRYHDLVAEAVELARWEGADNPLTEMVLRLADAVEELSRDKVLMDPNAGSLMIRSGKHYVELIRDGSVWISGTVKIDNRVS